MILIDTSAWIEFLRDTGSRTCRRVDELLGEPIETCGPVALDADVAVLHADRDFDALARVTPLRIAG